MDYVLETDLQSDEFMLIARAGANDGDGTAVNNAKYQIHTPETFLLIDKHGRRTLGFYLL